MAPGIAVFVSIRLTGEPGPAYANALERRATQEGGCSIPPDESSFFCAVFHRVTSALFFVRQTHEALNRDNQQTKGSVRASVGVECGEQPSQPTKRNQTLDRSVELAGLANPGQNLLGPVAKELARTVLPGGFMLIELGEIKLGSSISADKISQLSIVGFPDDFPRIDALDEVFSNVLDWVGDFIGRESESLKIQKLLLESNLVSIVGPAGVGKSALAHWLAFDLAEAYRDGTWRVDLSKIPRGGNVATAIVAELRLPGGQSLLAEDRVKIAFATMDGLVWLDNCEHVLQETRDLLSRVLKYCPKVKFLVTSRMALRLDEELVLELSPFEIPDDVEDVADLEAVRLFVSRVKAANPSVSFSPSDLLKIAKICKKVDGLPLAIELAAAQASKIPLDELDEHLTEALKGTNDQAPARHRTLERALLWSYSLLSEAEKKFFRLLGALAGPANRDLAVAVGMGGKKSLQAGEAILDALVSASLVQKIGTKGAGSYRLLEPLREFAINQLVRQDEFRKAKTRFASECISWIEGLEEKKMPMSRWVSTVDKERANLEASLEWLLQDPKTGRLALTLAVALYDYWIRKGPYDGAHTWYDRALKAGRSTPARDTADIYNWMGTFAGYAGRYEDSIASFKEAIRLYQKAGNNVRQAVALQNMSIHLRNSDQLDKAIAASKEAMVLSPDDDQDLSMRTGNVAFYLAEAGQLDESREWLNRAIDLNKERDDPWTRACQESQLSYLALIEGQTAKAEEWIAKSIASYRECGNLQGLLSTIEFAAFIALRMGNFERAAKLIGGTDRYFLDVGVGRPPKDEDRKRKALEEIRSALGPDDAEGLYVVGALLSLDALYDLSRIGGH